MLVRPALTRIVQSVSTGGQGPGCCFCLIAAATVLGLASIGSSHAPTWCLCTGLHGSGQLALPLVVPERQPSGSVPGRPHPVEERQRCPVRRSADSSGQCNSSSAISSVGFAKPGRLRGRSLSSSATVSRSATVTVAKSVPFGKYWRSNPLVFSFEPRCQGAWGSQK